MYNNDDGHDSPAVNKQRKKTTKPEKGAAGNGYAELIPAWTHANAEMLLREHFTYESQKRRVGGWPVRTNDLPPEPAWVRA